MKKAVLTFGLTICLATAFCQRNQLVVWPSDPSTGHYIFSGSVYVMNADADHLLAAAMRYFEAYFNAPGDSLLLFDERARRLMAQGNFLINVDQLGANGKGKLLYTFSFSCINNLYKYSFTNFRHTSLTAKGATGGDFENDMAFSGGASFPRRYWDEVKERGYYVFQNKVEQLKEFMEKHAAGQVDTQ